MTLLVALQSIAVALVMCLALGWDVRTRRIPNSLTLTGLAAALVLRAPLGAAAVGSGLAGAGIALLFTFPLFALGGLGGGDAKLLIAAGAFLGPEGLLTAALVAGVLGGVMAVVTMVRRGIWIPILLSCKDLLINLVTLGRAGERPSLDSPGALKIPYGVAIALGTLVAWFMPLLERSA
jgi:prepilin peptidase CpaA